ncbi:8030_t:CDS:1, partial [Scutellospora calospora]
KELVYIDAIASLNTLNTSLTIISTNTSISGLPLATILTLDKIIIILTKALDILKHIILLTIFSRHRLFVRPQIIITDNSTAERK